MKKALELVPWFILKLTTLLRITSSNVRFPYTTRSIRPKWNMKNCVLQRKHIKTSFTANFLLYTFSVKFVGLDYSFADNYKGKHHTYTPLLPLLLVYFNFWVLQRKSRERIYFDSVLYSVAQRSKINYYFFKIRKEEMWRLSPDTAAGGITSLPIAHARQRTKKVIFLILNIKLQLQGI